MYSDIGHYRRNSLKRTLQKGVENRCHTVFDQKLHYERSVWASALSLWKISAVLSDTPLNFSKPPNITWGWQFDPGKWTLRPQHLCDRKNTWAFSWCPTLPSELFWDQESRLSSIGLMPALFRGRIHSITTSQRLSPWKKIEGPLRADFETTFAHLWEGEGLSCKSSHVQISG